MRRATGVLVLAVLVGGCGGDAEAEPTEFVALPGLPLRISVPQDVEVMQLRDRVQVTLRPRTRRPLGIWIERAGAPEPELELREGALAYRLEKADAGMGGEQLQLIGRVEVGGEVYAVRCVEESEERMTLGWCLRALATLQVQ